MKAYFEGKQDEYPVLDEARCGRGRTVHERSDLGGYRLCGPRPGSTPKRRTFRRVHIEKGYPPTRVTGSCDGGGCLFTRSRFGGRRCSAVKERHDEPEDQHRRHVLGEF